MAGDPLELIAVEVSAKLDHLDSQMQGAAKVVDVNAQRITQSIQKTERQIVASSDNAGQAMDRTGGASRQMAMQFSQMGQQVLTGTSPLQALAIQLPDLAVVMGQTGGEAGKLATFFGGPWGIALATAAAMTLPLIGRLFETEDALDGVGDAADKAMAKVRAALNQTTAITDAATENTRKLITGMGSVAQVNREILQAQSTLNTLSRTFGGADAAQAVQGQLAALYRRKEAAEKEVQSARRNLSELRDAGETAARQAGNRDRLNSAPSEGGRTRSPGRGANIRVSVDGQADALARQAARQNELYDKTKNQMELEQLLAGMRGEGAEAMSKMADKLEAIARIQAQFPELANSTLEADQERLQILYDISSATIDEAYNRKTAKEAAEQQVKAEREGQRAREKAADELARRQEDQIHTLANLYEDAFRGGTSAIWDDFKGIGLRVIAEVLAKFSLAQLSGKGGGFSLTGALSSAIGKVLPGFATGGSMVIGGRGGTDNNILSLNGSPVARVSAGEMLNISNPALSKGAGGGQQIVVKVEANDYFDARVAGISQQVATPIAQQVSAQTSAMMGQNILKSVPGRIATFQRDGT